MLQIRARADRQVGFEQDDEREDRALDIGRKTGSAKGGRLQERPVLHEGQPVEIVVAGDAEKRVFPVDDAWLGALEHDVFRSEVAVAERCGQFWIMLLKL